MGQKPAMAALPDKRERNCRLPGTKSVCLGRNQAARTGGRPPLLAVSSCVAQLEGQVEASDRLADDRVRVRILERRVGVDIHRDFLAGEQASSSRSRGLSGRSGCRTLGCPSPSRVVTCAPSATVLSGVTQDLLVTPSMITVHAPPGKWKP